MGTNYGGGGEVGYKTGGEGQVKFYPFEKGDGGGGWTGFSHAEGWRAEKVLGYFSTEA